MADPNQDQDELVSQDDIDRLLASSSIEEAEENLETVDISSEIDDMGELSQDDIDSLMGGQTDALETEDAEEDSELSRDDIDSLLNSGPENAPDGVQEDMEDDFGELSQNDIDSLMGGKPDNPSEDAPEADDRQDADVENDTLADDEEEIELIDQSDIDRLMNQSPDQEVSLESAAPLGGPEAKNAQEPAARDDFVISPDQAADPADCLVTQDTLDTLMQNVPETAPAPDFAAVDDEETPLAADAPEIDETGLDAALLDEPAPEAGQNDVSQEDIDALLQDPEEEAKEEEEAEQEEKKDVVDLEDEGDLLISQDDIDTLLMADDQEDEDILEDVLGNDFEDMLDDEYSQDNDADQEGPDNDQVVLEASDASETMVIADKPSGTGRKWYRSKLLLAAASVLLVLAITVPAAYFLFFPRMPELPSANQPIQPVPLAAQEMTAEMETDTVLNENLAAGNMAAESIQVEVPPVQPVAGSGNMVLKNFIVLTSDQAADMAYVTMDISIDYSDQRAYDEINSNLAFFRDLIYASIQQNLVWEKRNEVTQNELIRGVETGLQKVLPPGYIESISFLSFKTS